MAPLIEQNRERIIELCKRYGITRLDVFGSAARGDDFDPASDVDFFYEIDESPEDWVDRWLSFIADMQDLLERPVQLVSERHVTNPYFLPVANESRLTLYAA